MIHDNVYIKWLFLYFLVNFIIFSFIWISNWSRIHLYFWYLARVWIQRQMTFYLMIISINWWVGSKIFVFYIFIFRKVFFDLIQEICRLIWQNTNFFVERNLSFLVTGWKSCFIALFRHFHSSLGLMKTYYSTFKALSDKPLYNTFANHKTLKKCQYNDLKVKVNTFSWN